MACSDRSACVAPIVHPTAAMNTTPLHPGITIAPPRLERHPGRVLKDDFLKPRGITIGMLAERSGLDEWRIRTLLTGTRAIDAPIAVRLANALGTTPLYRMLLQAQHELLLRQRLRRASSRVGSMDVPPSQAE